MSEEFLEALNILESLNGVILKQEHIKYLLETFEEAEAFFKFTFNDIKYGLQEQSFRTAFSYYDRQYTHISDWLEVYNQHNTENEATIADLIEFGNTLNNLSGARQLLELKNWFIKLTSLQAKWFSRALLKDLRCGIGLKSLNSCFKYLGLKEIKKFSMMLCGKTKNMDLFGEAEDVKKKIQFPCCMECKYDGNRLQAEVFIKDGAMDCILTSRRGTDNTHAYPEIAVALCEQFKGQHVILDGEIISRSFQELSRKNSKAKRKFVVFDLLMDEELPYINRWNNLLSLFVSTGYTEWRENKIINNINKTIVLAEHYNCNSIEEAQEYYNVLNERGEEGIILKNNYAPYVRGSRKHMFKFKKVYTCDLLCVDFLYGEGKRANKIGSLCLKDASSTKFVSVGSGLSDEMVEELTKQIKTRDFIGKIVEIAYNEITETGSLRFPRFIKFRDDKTEPDDLSEANIRQGEK